MKDWGVPVVDMNHYSDPDRREQFLQTLGTALEEVGFVALTNHPVDLKLLERAYLAASAVFSMPLAAKQACETPEDGRQRGYTSYGVEHAKDQPEADLKEFWHVGRTADALSGSPLTVELPVNQFPAEEPAFEQAMGELFHTMDQLSLKLLQAIAIHLGWAEDAFEPMVRQGNTVLRIIHYPPVAEGVAPAAVRAAAHEDINLITILPVSTQPGLELLSHDGRWISVNPPAGVLLLDTGDMMQMLTNGRLRATTHRVINPKQSKNESRYSLPFFVHPHPEVVLQKEPGKPVVTAGEYLTQRLRAIGVA